MLSCVLGGKYVPGCVCLCFPPSQFWVQVAMQVSLPLPSVVVVLCGVRALTTRGASYQLRGSVKRPGGSSATWDLSYRGAGQPRGRGQQCLQELEQYRSLS